MQSGYSTKYNIPLDHLDFAYITKCSDIKELEKILKILRSREDGCFPELELHCEEKLAKLCPNSRLLRMETPLGRGSDLSADELNSLNRDMNSWTEEMNNLESSLKSKRSGELIDTDNIPVRTQHTYDAMNGEVKAAQPVKAKKRALPRGYDEWDKLNIDEEMAKADEPSVSVPDIKPTTTHQTPPAVIDGVTLSGMTEEERSIRASREKDKGNEAFKAGDYEESALYYTRSIALQPSIHAYNNRALSYLKLSRWKSAISDCKHILKQDPDNIKALMRCGSAYKGNNDWARAVSHFHHVLELEPSNKKASDLLHEIEKEKEASESAAAISAKGKGHRMVIEEVDGDESNDNDEPLRNDAKSRETIGKNGSINDKGETFDGSAEADGSDFGEQTAANEKLDASFAENLKDEACDGSLNEKKGECYDMDRSVGSCLLGSGQSAGSDEVSSVHRESINDEQDERTRILYDEKVERINRKNESLKAEPVSGDLRIDRGENDRVICNSVETENELNERLEKRLLKSHEQKMGGNSVSVDTGSKSLRESSEGSAIVEGSAKSVESESKSSRDTESCESGDTLEQTVPSRLQPVFYKSPLRPDIEADKQSGNSLFRSGQYADALIKYTAAIGKLEKEDKSEVHLSTLYTNRATCHNKIGDMTAAIKDCNAALAVLPHSVKPLLRRAAAYEQLERYADALRDYKHVHMLDSSVTTAFQGSTRCLAMMKEVFGFKWQEKVKPQPVIQSHDRPVIVDLSTDSAPSTDTPVGVSPAVSGRNVENRSGQDGGKAEMKTADMTDDEKFEQWKQEGNVWVKTGDYQMAVTCYTECAKLLPGRAVSYTNRALCYLKLNKNVEAEEDCSKALVIEPDNVKALFRRAQARKNAGNYKQSLSDLTKLLKLEPNNSAAKKEMDNTKVLWRKQLEQLKNNTSPPPKPGSQTSSKAAPASRRMDIEEVDDDTASDNKLKEKSPKHQQSQPKSQKSPGVAVPTTVPVLDEITPFEFMKAWNSLKAVKGTHLHAKLIRQVPPEHLSKVFTNKLDGDILTRLVKCLSDHIMPEGDIDLTYLILHNLTKVQRFSTISRFLSKHEKLVMEEILGKLRSRQSNSSIYKMDDIANIEKLFGL